MDFFKSVFSDELEPEKSLPESSSSTSSPLDSQTPQSPNHSVTSPPKIATITNAWTLGSSLIRTLASKSESVLDTYRRDLEEFSSGLKKETAVIREAATRAVKDLPTSLEAGAAAAQESLESVGEAIDNLGNTVSEIIAQGKESLLADDDSDADNISVTRQITGSSEQYSSKPYSRLDAQIRMIQCDMNTYLEEPDDLDEYNEWKSSGFVLDEKVEEIEDLMSGNGVIEEIYNEIVPAKVDEELFWSRYFYRVHKVKKAEEARAKLVKRVIDREEDEELTWDVDEDDYEENDGSKLKAGDSDGRVEEKMGKSEAESESKSLKKENDDMVRGVSTEKEMGEAEAEVEPKNNQHNDIEGVPESKDGNRADERGTTESGLDESKLNGDNLGTKSDEKMSPEPKTDKDSDFSVISSQPSHEEEDGWDEIEDAGSSDDIKVASRGSPNSADLRKRLIPAEEEEDLTWDIEDDDEPVRS